jgi:integration host factor subunit alpha
MTLTKMDMAHALVKGGGLDLKDSQQVVNTVFEVICNTLEKGEEVKISGFGNLAVRLKKERPGRNPKTGKAVSISRRQVATFHAGQKLKKEVATGG